MHEQTLQVFKKIEEMKVEFGDAFSLLKDRIDSVAAEIEIQELKQ